MISLDTFLTSAAIRRGRWADAGVSERVLTIYDLVVLRLAEALAN